MVEVHLRNRAVIQVGEYYTIANGTILAAFKRLAFNDMKLVADNVFRTKRTPHLKIFMNRNTKTDSS